MISRSYASEHAALTSFPSNGTGGRPVYTMHARRQMSDPSRGITEEHVERLLLDHDMSRTDAEGNLRLSGEIGDGRRLLVVVARGSRPARIISVWPTGRRRRV